VAGAGRAGVAPERDPTLETLRALLSSRRDFLPLSRRFLQQRRAGGGPGPLSWFVRARRLRALNLYLLAHAIASSPPPTVGLASSVWARALGMSARPSSAVQISTNWTWLEDHRLVKSQRLAGRRQVLLLNDDGSGRPYEHPSHPKEGKPDYLKLPYAFWLERWHTKLDLPATAVLLIGLSLGDHFQLPQDHAAAWYGISRDTIGRGLRGLEAHGLLEHLEWHKRAPRAPTGVTSERYYTLLGPFASRLRQSQRPGGKPGAKAVPSLP